MAEVAEQHLAARRRCGGPAPRWRRRPGGRRDSPRREGSAAGRRLPPGRLAPPPRAGRGGARRGRGRRPLALVGSRSGRTSKPARGSRRPSRSPRNAARERAQHGRGHAVGAETKRAPGTGGAEQVEPADAVVGVGLGVVDQRRARATPMRRRYCRRRGGRRGQERVAVEQAGPPPGARSASAPNAPARRRRRGGPRRRWTWQPAPGRPQRRRVGEGRVAHREAGVEAEHAAHPRVVPGGGR